MVHGDCIELGNRNNCILHTSGHSPGHINWISEIEKLLLNPVISRTYTEEYGEYKGVSRIIVSKFKVYYKRRGDDIVIVAVKFPGEE